VRAAQRREDQEAEDEFREPGPDDGSSPSQIASLANLSRWAFLLTFAGVGLNTNFAELRKQGVRPLVGAIGEVGIAAVTLGMVLAADAVFSLG
jgi:hypothetical protein